MLEKFLGALFDGQVIVAADQREGSGGGVFFPGYMAMWQLFPFTLSAGQISKLSSSPWMLPTTESQITIGNPTIDASASGKVLVGGYDANTTVVTNRLGSDQRIITRIR